jgi:hypothetical protein
MATSTWSNSKQQDVPLKTIFSGAGAALAKHLRVGS